MDTSKAKSTILTQRYSELQDWLAQMTPEFHQAPIPLAGDASFRRYYRVRIEDKSYVLMDAPPDRESCQPFVLVAKNFKKMGVMVPEVRWQDIQRGFLVLSDLGDHLYFRVLSASNASALYQRAFDALLKIQQCTVMDDYILPNYNETLLRAEMQLCIDWYFEKYRQMNLTQDQHEAVFRIFDLLVENALQQPQVCVHRDYHSRNLLVCEEGVGVLDFQDAVFGAVTYDLVSLLKDCYIDWPEQQVEAWVQQYYAMLLQQNLLSHCSFAQFLRWFDWMGLQRHLKCLGIFSRLHLRDQKPAYLKDIPRVLNYVRRVCARYPELSALIPLLTVD